MIWLRPILLLAGALFIAALFWWERRRPRQAAQAPAARTERTEPSFEAGPLASPGGEREQRRALPVIDWAVEAMPAGASATPVAHADARTDAGVHTRAAAGDAPAEGVLGKAQVAAQPVTVQLPEPLPMVIDWPDESARRIVTLRIVPSGTERLPGRAVRQGLSACGFRHGEFGIFHLPGDDGRVILSAASLVRPGTLDPAAMDFQRYAGLNVFAVLPGPLNAELALERLGQVALELAGRVCGRVHDEHSAPLGAAAAGEWRRRVLGTLGAQATAAATTAAGEPAD